MFTSTWITVSHHTDLKLYSILAVQTLKHRLSNFNDIFLKEILKRIPSIIRDNMGLLNHLPKHATKDVINVYTKILQQHRPEAIKFWPEKYPNDVPERIKIEFIIEGLKVILPSNFLSSNNNTCRIRVCDGY